MKAPSEYEMSALFTAAARAVAEHETTLFAKKKHDEETERLTNDLAIRASERQRFARACGDVVSGAAAIAWSDQRRRFIVTWPTNDPAKAPEELVLPTPPSSERAAPPPANAAHVGSSVQGRAGS